MTDSPKRLRNRAIPRINNLMYSTDTMFLLEIDNLIEGSIDVMKKTILEF
ncbi:hypothetical protein BpHYR1_049814 [Brachionus plicatilis]|uniref:Uncharacterized protein n=1 Tax=Brachionus plicatilis TaxID=10195 RepID=A0A3M7RKY2_BRAPC|nr:hypothetical protein BpHYR1_049814 [Brachionus plicatilis]